MASGHFSFIGGGGRDGAVSTPAGTDLTDHRAFGNFSFIASEINAFDPLTGMFEGSISIDVGAGHTPGGLWFIGFGGGTNGGPSNALFFTDGIDGETHGLFGAITSPVPLPAALPLFATGVGLMGLLAWRRKRKGALPNFLRSVASNGC